jgi:predicted dehydrogenase
MAPVQIGFVGLGHHTLDCHFQMVKNLNGCFFVRSVFDPDPKRLALIDQDSGLEKVESVDHLFDNPAIEAVIIATPHELHLPLIKRAVGAGKHVFCEKPLCTSLEAAKELTEVLLAAEQRQLVITSCHPRRFDPYFLTLKKELPVLREKLGRVMEFNFRFHNRQAPSRWKAETNLLLDQVGHEIDLACWLLGDCPMQLHKEYDSPTAYSVRGRRIDGVCLLFSEDRCFDSNSRYFELELVFAAGRIIISSYLDVPAGRELVRRTETSFCERFATTTTEEKRSYTQVFKQMMINFYQSIREGEPSYLTRQDLERNTLASLHLTHNGSYDSTPDTH